MAKPIVEIKDRLQEALNFRRMSQQELSDITKIPKASISQYLSGYAKPKDDRIHLISKALDVQEPWLLGYDVSIRHVSSDNSSANYNRPKGVRIPVLGEVVAGVPIDAVEEYIDWEEITPELAETGDFFALKIKGDSMEPRIIAGDVVIVRMQSTAETGDIVIAMVNGDDACCKRFIKQNDGIILQSFNSAYTPMFFTKEDIETKPVSIIGKVIENRQKY